MSVIKMNGPNIFCASSNINVAFLSRFKAVTHVNDVVIANYGEQKII